MSHTTRREIGTEWIMATGFGNVNITHDLASTVLWVPKWENYATTKIWGKYSSYPYVVFPKNFVDDLAHKKLLGNEVTHSNRSGNTTHYIAHLGESWKKMSKLKDLTNQKRDLFIFTSPWSSYICVLWNARAWAHTHTHVK